jgi:DNA-directed RNA polymerase specialized sigma24 family protein
MRPARRGAESRPLLFSIAYGMTGSAGDAEDVVQDAFLGLTRPVRKVATTSRHL